MGAIASLSSRLCHMSVSCEILRLLRKLPLRKGCLEECLKPHSFPVILHRYMSIAFSQFVGVCCARVMPATEEPLCSNVVMMGVEIPLAEIEWLFHIFDINLENCKSWYRATVQSSSLIVWPFINPHSCASTTPRLLRFMIFLVLVKTLAAFFSNHRAQIVLINVGPRVGCLLLLFASFVLLPNLLLAKLIVAF
jgi:hypothetical protein